MNTNTTISTPNYAGIKILCLLFFLFYGFTSYSQHFSNLYYDDRGAMLFGSIQEQNDNYYATGVTTTKWGPPYYQKALLGKFYQDGSVDTIFGLIDSNQYSYDIFANALKKTRDGNFIAAGDMIDTTGKVFMMKADTNGKILLWQEYTYPGEDLFHGQDIIEVPGEGYLIAVNINFTIGNKSDVLIIRVDTSGTVLNQRLYSAGSQELPNVIRPMYNGHYMIGAGSVKNNTNTPYWARTWLIEVDAMGNPVRNWLDRDSSNLWPTGMQQTADSGWIIVRQHVAYDISDVQAYNASILKLDKNFNKQWEIDTGGIDYDAGMYDVEILPDGNYICVGSNAINITQDSVHDYGWIMKVSAAGDILWQSNYLADTHFGTDQFLYDVNILDNGDLLACGELDYTYDVGITPIVQGWILRTDSNGCLLDQCWLGVNDINPPEVVTVKEYPNPASKEIIFEKSDEGKPVTLDIYNLLGQKVFESKLFSTLKVPTDMWQQAVYTWRAKQEGNSIGQGKVEIIK